jgi:uncharacterized Fe-S cluster-containing radical SAM superfamily enzyme
MKEERIRIKILEDGSVKLEVIGVKGQRCVDLTKDLEEELGIVTKQVKTKEYHERPARVTTQTVSNIHRK